MKDGNEIKITHPDRTDRPSTIVKETTAVDSRSKSTSKAAAEDTK